MIVHVPGVLATSPLTSCRQLLQQADWQDGRGTAGFQSALVKNNLQLPADSEQGLQAAALIDQGLARNPLFMSAALPARIFPKLFNVCGEGQSFGLHVDNAIRYAPGATSGIRTDLSATLFLSEPDSYDGGELVIQDTYGEHAVKLPAGDMVLYPAGSLHRVTPVTRHAPVLILLDPEHDPRRWPARAAVRPGRRHPGCRAAAGRRPWRGGSPDRHLPQPAAPLGASLALPAPKASRVPDAAGPAALAEAGLRRHPRSGEPPPCPCLPLARTRPKNCV